MYKLCVYIPESDVESVKNALFEAGAGTIGNYERCCWQVAGEGQFRALDGSNPAIGDIGAVTSVREYRVEMVCSDENIQSVIQRLRQAHPYEEPAFDVLKVIDVESM